MKRIDAFQMKGLRKILDEKHTYWDREATNENILDQANWIINQKGKHTNAKNKKQNQKQQESASKEERELRWLYADNYEHMVQQEKIPGPRMKDNSAAQTGGRPARLEEQSLEREILEAIWIKHDDHDLQWAIGR